MINKPYIKERHLINLILKTDLIKEEFHVETNAENPNTLVIYDSDMFINWLYDLRNELNSLSTRYNNDFFYKVALLSKKDFNGWHDENDFSILEENLNLLLQELLVGNYSESIKRNNSPKEAAKTMDKVFIVHGHDNEAKETVARVIEKLGFQAIILHEQASPGIAIIEKIEKYSSDIVFSIVLYTQCDIGRDKNADEKSNKYRARQNVVFEHGLLIGKWGRERVLPIVKGEVETPGDISGMIYTKMDDSGAWKLELVNNMKAAGLNVSADKLLN